MNVTIKALFARLVSSSALVASESAYLLSYGWIPSIVYTLGKGHEVLWTSPVGYRKDHVNVHRTHAVNSQRATARLEAAPAEQAAPSAPSEAKPAASSPAPTKASEGATAEPPVAPVPTPAKPRRGRAPKASDPNSANGMTLPTQPVAP